MVVCGDGRVLLVLWRDKGASGMRVEVVMLLSGGWISMVVVL